MQRKSNAHKNEDNHHLLYPRKVWGKGYRYALRTHPYCIVLIDKKTLHRSLHGLVTHIPIPSEENAKAALEQLNMLWQFGAIHRDDSVKKRLTLLVALFEYVEQPTANALKEQLEIVQRFHKSPP